MRWNRWTPDVRRVGALLLATFVCITTACVTEGSEQASPTPDSADEACELLVEAEVASSRIDIQDLDSMRLGVPAVAAALAKLPDVAPGDIAAEVSVLVDRVDEWLERIDDPSLSLDENTLYVWKSPESVDAAERIGTWAQARCVVPEGASLLEDRAVRLCLPEGADRAAVQELVERTNVPSSTGTGFDLLEGLVAVGFRSDGVEVTISRFASEAGVDSLLRQLGEPPVVEIVAADEECR